MSSADPAPIAPARFAAALKDLSIEVLHIKVLEIRNSVAHLQYSNDQLRPFAEGSATPLDGRGGGGQPDQDCVDAIRENELVIDRMAERIALVRFEVEDRGGSWTEFQSKEEADEAASQAASRVNGQAATENGGGADGEGGAAHDAWADGTFQTGTIRNGEVRLDGQAGRPQGGSLSDAELRRALEERMRDMGVENDDDDDGNAGMHL